MFNTLANWEPTPEFYALSTILVTGIGRWWWEASKNRNTRLSIEAERAQRLKEREEDRKDLLAAAEAAATLNQERLDPVMEQLKSLDQAGTNRLKVLLSSNVTTRQFTRKALDTANNVNEKIKDLNQHLVDTKNTPRNVKIVNELDEPVPTIETHDSSNSNI